MGVDSVETYGGGKDKTKTICPLTAATAHGCLHSSDARTNLEIIISDARAMGIELSAIGVLRDADAFPNRALQSVTDALRSLNLPAPNAHGAFIQGLPSVVSSSCRMEPLPEPLKTCAGRLLRTPLPENARRSTWSVSKNQERLSRRTLPRLWCTPIWQHRRSLPRGWAKER